MFRRQTPTPIRNPWWTLGNMLIVMGLVLIFFTWLYVYLSPGGQGANSVSYLGRTPTALFPSPTNPISSAELLVNGFNAPDSEESPVPISTPGEEPTSTNSQEGTPTPIAQLTETPSAPEPTKEEVKRAPPATRLVIPALGIDAPVAEVPIINKTWDVSGLTYEIAHLAGTANPGEKNNMVLAGHVTLKRGAGPFLHVESLEPGDEAIVYAGEQAYTYRVVEKKNVAPTDVSVAYPTSDPILTLITCTDWDAQNRKYLERVAVIAELAEGATP